MVTFPFAFMILLGTLWSDRSYFCNALQQQKHEYQQQRDLIVNGVDTVQGRYPYHVRVGCCSGVLIAPDMVLSAGHVLPPPDAVKYMKLYLNSYDVPHPEKDAQKVTIQQAFLHPNYTTIQNDFVIFQIIIDESIMDVDHLDIVKFSRDAKFPYGGEDVSILGTGTFNLTTSERPKVLQEASTVTLSQEECRLAYDPNRGVSYSWVGETNFCTFSDKDGCVFDSGAPIIVPSTDDPKEDLLVGLISYGVDCADPIYPAVNSRVSAVHTWIEDVVCKNSLYPVPSDYTCSTSGPSPTSISSKKSMQASFVTMDGASFFVSGNLFSFIMVFGMLVVASILLSQKSDNTARRARHHGTKLPVSNGEQVLEGERKTLLAPTIS